MGSDSPLQGQSPRPFEASRSFQARPAEASLSVSSSVSSASSSPLPSPLSPQDVQLELERLRAERDALAAELQIERAERLRAEERLRLFEREKLEQMREGAASREKLASELEEARLRAMRAEARQAALDADLRLSEIAERRRGWPGADGDADAAAGEIAEPDPEASTEADEPGPAMPLETARPQRLGATPMGAAGAASKYTRLTRPASAPGPTRPGRESAAPPAPPTREARGEVGASSEWVARDSSRTERPGSAAAEDADSSGGGRLRMSEVPQPRWPSQGADPTPARDDRGGAFGAASSAPRTGAPPRTGAQLGGRGSGATGGAAAGRPSIDRAQLEMRLAAGQRIETTERFRRFQPVAQAHIKICDWLARARTLDEIDALAAGEIARSEIISILTLFFERSFLVFK
jgi:hypothetical protein